MHLRASHDAEEGFYEHEVICVFLLHAKRLGPCSDWAPWFDTIPTSFPHTVFWSGDELDALQGSFVRSATTAKLQELESRWEVLRPYCSDDDRLEDFWWAHCA